jgi:predicted RNase H-like HicB family nuclease
MEYHVIYTPDADGVRWNARVKEKVNGTGCSTWGRSLREARTHLREALAVALEDDKAAEKAVLHEEFQLPNARGLKGLRARREKVEEQVRALADETAREARELHKRGFSMRDIAELVGTSHQRVQQWVAEKGGRQ